MVNKCESLNDLNDVELSKALAEALGWEVIASTSCGVVVDRKVCGVFCISNWCDIMPIATESNVFFTARELCGDVDYKAFSVMKCGSHNHRVISNTAQRAMAICIILLNLKGKPNS